MGKKAAEKKKDFAGKPEAGTPGTSVNPGKEVQGRHLRYLDSPRCHHLGTSPSSPHSLMPGSILKIGKERATLPTL